MLMDGIGLSGTTCTFGLQNLIVQHLYVLKLIQIALHPTGGLHTRSENGANTHMEVNSLEELQQFKKSTRLDEDPSPESKIIFKKMMGSFKVVQMIHLQMKNGIWRQSDAFFTTIGSISYAKSLFFKVDIYFDV